MTAIGVLPLARRLWVLDPGWSVAGAVRIILVDPLALLFDRMAGPPICRGWLRQRSNVARTGAWSDGCS
ncbi:hypothetical protein OB2597_11981 [Pseudooceanicola batsensis HTCC2597]|uniref:Uncharacterized protein n=1 Tax=Pseudooceanicola batsensis (strain ATCC BAA-863 / DSM 15984 / KCTC 12145 / HTCC2597) TaxID=252305 RepID=A3TWG6_PSEBH|nr:hypothetical protein OB2597_11981 [Pseudooceanicola batsensis HTCC2597]